MNFPVYNQLSIGKNSSCFTKQEKIEHMIKIIKFNIQTFLYKGRSETPHPRYYLYVHLMLTLSSPASLQSALYIVTYHNIKLRDK